MSLLRYRGNTCSVFLMNTHVLWVILGGIAADGVATSVTNIGVVPIKVMKEVFGEQYEKHMALLATKRRNPEEVAGTIYIIVQLVGGALIGILHCVTDSAVEESKSIAYRPGWEVWLRDVLLHDSSWPQLMYV